MRRNVWMLPVGHQAAANAEVSLEIFANEELEAGRKTTGYG